MIVLDDNVVSIQATDPASNPGFASTCIDGVVVSCQPPWASQICFCPLLQRVELGTQEPPHTPAEQRYGHAVPLCHAPFAVHVCGTLFAHWCAPGVHDPAHAPFVQTYWHAVPDCQSPAAVQVCGTLLLQFT